MVLTYNYDEERPGKDWVLKTDHGLDGDSLSYLDSMERNSQEEERRARERQLMDEGRQLWQQKRAEEQDLATRDVEEIKELARLKMFGKPGHGAPTGDIRKKRFTEHQQDQGLKRSTSMFNLEDATESMSFRPIGPSQHYTSEVELNNGDALSFGRDGSGAPVRTNSGRLRSTLRGNPDIRFQANEGVQKSICNQIRYAADPAEKSMYHSELAEQVEQRKQRAEMEKHNDLAIARNLEDVEGSQWGKPGPGGAYWRDSALTGQGFFEKMGWNGSADPRRRQYEIKKGENEDMKREMSQIEAMRVQEHRNMTSDVGCELAPLMSNMETGKPRKDPSTGYMMNHSLSSTDITKHADMKGSQPWHSSANKQQYWETLTGQVQERADVGARNRETHDQQEHNHFQQSETFWGKPGNGAPRDKVQKENLMKMLHYNDPAMKNAPNNMELLTLERLPVK